MQEPKLLRSSPFEGSPRHEKEKETSQPGGHLEVLGSRPSPGVVKPGHTVQRGVEGNAEGTEENCGFCQQGILIHFFHEPQW